MSESAPFFQVPLNLPHAGRVARRILKLLRDAEAGRDLPPATLALTAAKLDALLAPYVEMDDNPPQLIATQVRTETAILGRKLVDEIESARVGHDRLGQCVRNLFECLELGREGAAVSLRAGENPNSFQRPV